MKTTKGLLKFRLPGVSGNKLSGLVNRNLRTCIRTPKMVALVCSPDKGRLGRNTATRCGMNTSLSNHNWPGRQDARRPCFNTSWWQASAKFKHMRHELWCILLGCSDFNFLPTNGFSIKPLKVKLLAGQLEATELKDHWYCSP